MTSLPWVTHQDVEVLLKRILTLEHDISVIKMKLFEQDHGIDEIKNSKKPMVEFCKDLGSHTIQTECLSEDNAS